MKLPARLFAFLLALFAAPAIAGEIERFVRYEIGGVADYGKLEGETILELTGPPFSGVEKSGRKVALKNVDLLPPSVPSKVLAVGLNYRSHAGMSGAREPALFAKLPSSLIGPGRPIVIPKEAGQPHYEGELVVVIGKQARHVSVAEAGRYVFGVTAGNDVSERGWQRGDLQWLRAAAMTTCCSNPGSMARCGSRNGPAC